LRVSSPNRKGNNSETQWKKQEGGGKKVGQGEGASPCSSGDNELWKMEGNAGGGGCSSSRGALSAGGRRPNSKELILGEQVYGGDPLCPRESKNPCWLCETEKSGGNIEECIEIRALFTLALPSLLPLKALFPIIRTSAVSTSF